MSRYFWVIVTAILLWSCGSRQPQLITSYVNPIIGTGGHGHTFPGPALPFGQIQPGPDNGRRGWDWSSGYHFSDSLIAGFSHTHLSGTGCPDLSDILFIPVAKNIDSTIFDFDAEVTEKLIEPFEKHNEKASMGYYSVKLNNGILVELTATKRVAFHRYTFPKNEKRQIVIDLAYSKNDDATLATNAMIADSFSITGYRFSTGWARVHKVYFVAKFSERIESFKLFSDSKNNKAKVLLTFIKTDVPLYAKVAISSVDTSGARNNLMADNNGFDFDAVVRKASLEWLNELGKIQVETSDEALRQVFYTAMYHSMLAPYTFSDADGRYKGFGHNVRMANGYTQYTVLSLWDTFRALKPLFSIIQPRVANDIVKSMLAKYIETDTLPVWELMGNETYTMPGLHAIPVIADVIQKGLGDFDKELAYNAMKSFAYSNYRGLKYFRELGYVPCDKEPESVSKTLEYAYNFWCIAKTAEYLGKTDDSRQFYQYSENFKNLFDEKTGFMRPRRYNGDWLIPFDPFCAEPQYHSYTEGNAWQWTWFVPHNTNGLAALYSGNHKLVQKLNALFVADSMVSCPQIQADVTGLIGQYAHGNEPGHGTAYIYEVINAEPWRTQYIVDRILNIMYSNKPNGLSGNEDCGQMSAWFIFSSIGFYPYCPGDNKYYFARPMFDRVTMLLPNGNKFKVIARNNNRSNKYFSSVKLNGTRLERHYITHQEIMAGGELVFEMTDKHR